MGVMHSDLRKLSDVDFERYLDTYEGRADAGVDTEILIRLFKKSAVKAHPFTTHPAFKTDPAYIEAGYTGLKCTPC